MTRILIDVDGVLADFVSAALSIVRYQTGRVHTPDEVTAYDIWGCIGLPPDEAAICKRVIGETHGLARELAVYPGALDGVRALEAIAELYIVTSPWNSNPTWTHDREWWLHKHFGISHARVVHTSAKHLVRGDVFVDDRVDTCARWQAEHPTGLAVVWDAPHNQSESFAGPRTNNWSELVAIVERQRVAVGLRELAAKAPLVEGETDGLFDDGGDL